jgi:hypothetical protein
MSSEEYYKGRYQTNERSRAWAVNDGKPWSGEEDDFIWELWVHTDPAVRDEIGVSQVLERTVEACRNRAEHLRRGGYRPPLVAHRKVTIETTVTYDDVCPRCFLIRTPSRACGC